MFPKLPLIVEIIGIITTISGIFYELKTGQEIGLVVITVGSVIIATGSMLYAKVLKGRKR